MGLATRATARARASATAEASPARRDQADLDPATGLPPGARWVERGGVNLVKVGNFVRRPTRAEASWTRDDGR